jgi:hypothetical protein
MVVRNFRRSVKTLTVELHISELTRLWVIAPA